MSSGPLTNVDDDQAGFLVGLPSGHPGEDGTEASLTVALTSKPTANVVLALASDARTEDLVAPASLTFTILNWKAPQTVRVTGVDDDLADGR